MAMINVCAKCMCDVLRWENEKWTCFECGHASDGLKTITVSSPDTEKYERREGHYLSSMYIPTDYEQMRNFEQFINTLEVDNERGTNINNRNLRDALWKIQR